MPTFNAIPGNSFIFSARQPGSVFLSLRPILLAVACLTLLYVGFFENAFQLLIAAPFLYGLGRIFISWTYRHDPDHNFLSSTYDISFFLRIVTTCLLYYLLLYTYGLPFVGDNDDYFYYKQGQVLSHAASSDITVLYDELQHRHPGYILISALIPLLTDPLGLNHAMIPRFLNCMIGAWVVVLVRRISLPLLGDVISRRATALTALYPEYLYFSSLQLRDIILTWLLLLSLNIIVSDKAKLHLFSSLKIALLLILLWTFRRTYAYALGFVIAAIYFYQLLQKHSIIFNVYLLPFVFLFCFTTGPIVLYRYINDSYAESEIHKSEMTSLFLSEVQGGQTHVFNNQTRSLAADSASQKLHKSTSSTLRNVLFAALMHIMPYPPWTVLRTGWHPLKMYVFLNSIIWFFFIPFLLMGIKSAILLKPSNTIIIWAPYFTIVTLVGVSFFDPRYRLPVTCLGLILVSLGMSQQGNKGQYWLLHAVLFLAYNVAKS